MTSTVRSPAAAAADDEAVTELLDALAIQADPAEGIPFAAALLSWPLFTAEEMQEAWEAFQEAVRIRDALATGSRHWTERFAEADLPPGESLQEAAVQLACEVADEARNHLLNGGPR